MVQGKKYKIYIASFGYKEMIQAIIDVCGWTDYFHDCWLGSQRFLTNSH